MDQGTLAMNESCPVCAERVRNMTEHILDLRVVVVYWHSDTSGCALARRVVE
jgi:hypothetical protein